MSPPPERRNAAPGEPGHGSFGKQNEVPIPTPEAQAAESPLKALCKTWMRAGVTDRALFLANVRAGCPNLWRPIERNAFRP